MDRPRAFPQRTRHSSPKDNKPWLDGEVTPFLQFLPRLASVYPIPVVTLVAILASIAYVVLLDDTLSGAAGGLAWAPTQSELLSVPQGSRCIHTTPESHWTWRNCDPESLVPELDHLALLTLVFPGSVSADEITIPSIEETGVSATLLPPTANPTAIDGQDTALSLSVPYRQAPGYLTALRELRGRKSETDNATGSVLQEEAWIMEVVRSRSSGASFKEWILHASSGLWSILKTTQVPDIVFMALGYVSMILTFSSLFRSMRRLGSKFSLAASVLTSSSFAFLFGLLITTKVFCVPITMRLLSEGLPFLVVLVGFEKNILLTQAALSHSLEHKPSKGPSNAVQSALEAAIKETGFPIVRDYTVEILVVAMGAFSNIQGGLKEFCFLAAWILFFDCGLLLLFYAPILCIKLETNRIKRRIDIRNALEDDGISHRVAASVARSSGPGTPSTVFGRRISSIRDIPNLKAFVAGCFILLNLPGLAYMASIGRTSRPLLSSFSRYSHGHSGSLVDPFKIAPSGLDFLMNAAKLKNQELAVTVLGPVKYELAHQPVQGASVQANGDGGSLGLPSTGRRVAGSLLSSLEDPVLQKWIIGALSLSIVFNVYLYNAARWGINDDHAAEDRNLVDQANLVRAEGVTDNKDATACTSSPMLTAQQTPTPGDSESDMELMMSPTNPDQRGRKLPASCAEDAPAFHRTEEEIAKMHRAKRTHELRDDEIASLCLKGAISGHALEKTLQFDFVRAVKIRRNILSQTKVAANLTHMLDQSKLPFEDYNWSQVFGACCENVIGYMPIPLGVAGPLVIDGRSYFIPMATTEGVLVASTSRGAKAINAGGGAVTVLTSDGMTRGPCVGFRSLERAGLAKAWLDSPEGQATMKEAFNSTSRFARLETMDSVLAGTHLYIRFKATTADAMGMNMISKGVEHALAIMRDTTFDDMDIVTLTGNYCTDKKASAMNWIQGRGKGVVAEAIIPSEVVKNVLKTDIDSLVDIFVNKNMIGSAMAGSLGGFNAQAANIVAAIFIATGQDPAQVVESANCITIMKRVGNSLHITVSMPSIEVGTLGGGTILAPQGAMLDLLGIRGPHYTEPGSNARRLARIVAAATMAGELSLCSALAAGHLVSAHMQHNRSAVPTRSNTPAPPPAGTSPSPAVRT